MSIGSSAVQVLHVYVADVLLLQVFWYILLGAKRRYSTRLNPVVGGIPAAYVQ